MIYPYTLQAQELGHLVKALRLPDHAAVLLDGHLNETIWTQCAPATGFTVYEPDFGKKPFQETEVFFTYDDYGLFVGFRMHDPAPDSIFKDLSVRDTEGNSDWIALILSPSNDGQNGFFFEVTAAGVQIDSKIIMDGDADDDGWDAVWYSKTAINDTGWSAEFLIPWSALRFPNQDNQVWDINIMREVRRHREVSTWHPVDKKRHGFLPQSGKLTGLENLKTPIRLALMPYTSGYLQKLTGQDRASWTFNAGLDVKYGILNNYTLDVTLIPDFGQVRSDDEVYNFSPYEIKYNENRPFFTEGTELFNKAGIFYSRRIGSRPAGYYDVYDTLQDGEQIIANPAETQLINATKFSGRNSKGFAIGLFNAMTAPASALISDSLGNERTLETQGFTNYNMVVLDQSLKNNSYVHLANTNLYRHDFMANVTATAFQIKDKKQRIAFTGEGKLSQRIGQDLIKDPGYQFGLYVSKINGNLRWKAGHSTTNRNYNPNDMGYLAVNNQSNVYGELGYYEWKPNGKLLNYNSVLSVNYNMLEEDFQFTYLQLNLRGVATTVNQLWIGYGFEIVPTDFRDYYEARIPGRVFIQPGFTFLRLWSSPDYRKKFLADLNISGWKSNDGKQQGYAVNVSPRLRLNSRSLLLFSLNLDSEHPSLGYVSQININDTSIVLFGKRNINTQTSTISWNYIVNPRSAFTLRVRHYWVRTKYLEYFQLPVTGHVEPYNYQGDYSFTVNYFNVDLGYSWNFAPGSYLNIVYKNAIFSRMDGVVQHHYLRNWDDLLDSPANNSISVKLIYYIDYESIRKNTRRKAL
ncbi:MAG: DUF5916 domain-containing protein [Bacteroidales bacterium]